MATLPTEPLTEQQYLLIERQALAKSEFHNGHMFAMAGGSPNHSLLANRIGSLLDRQVSPHCYVFNAGLRIYIAAAGTYTYADCSVICGQPEYATAEQDNVLNPMLIVEVLSPSTEEYDRGKKFELYRTINSFSEYLLIDQEKPRVEHYLRQSDGNWLLREYSDKAANLNVDRLGVKIPLADLYAAKI